MKNLIYLLTPLFIFSCNSDEEIGGCCCFNIDTIVAMSVKSDDGKNLLDPKNPNAFHKNDIRLFYIEKGKKTEFYDDLLDKPKGFEVYPDSQRHEYVNKYFSQYR